MGPGWQPLAGAAQPQERTKPPFQPRAAITGRAGHRKGHARFPLRLLALLATTARKELKVTIRCRTI